jgi:hypothetical protein
MAKKSTVQDETIQEAIVAAKPTRARKTNIQPSVTEYDVNLSIDVVGVQTVSFNVEVSQVAAKMQNQLIARGLVSIIHDRTSNIKDSAEIPAMLEGMFTSLLNGTLLEAARQRKALVEIGTTVRAIMERDKLDVDDNNARLEALASWNALSKEDKLVLRQDNVLKNITRKLQGAAAAQVLVEQGIV